MAQSLRQDFEQLLAALPGFRKDLGMVVEAAGKQDPAMREALEALLKDHDDLVAEMSQTAPAALDEVEKGCTSMSRRNDELHRELEEAERKLSAPAAAPPAPSGSAPLPVGYAQTLRAELLARFGIPVPAAAPVMTGDVHDLTSGDWRGSESGATPSPTPAAPRPLSPPKPRNDDVGGMNTGDWR